VPVLTYHANLRGHRGPNRATIPEAQADLVELQRAAGAPVPRGTIVATRTDARTDALEGARADLLTALRAAGFDVSELPAQVDAALTDWAEDAAMFDDPEAEAALAADVQAWRRDRGVVRGEGL
jgi:hypothetical protein